MVNPGDPLRISADTWNRLQELLRRDTRAGMNIPAPGSPDRMVRVRNMTGTNLDICDVVILKVPTFMPTENLQECLLGLYSVYQPSPGDDGHGTLHYQSWDAFGVLTEPLADGEIGLAIADGRAPVRIYDPDDNPPWDYVLPRPEECHSVRRAPFGSRLLWTSPIRDEDNLRWGIIALPMQWPGVVEGRLVGGLGLATGGGFHSAHAMLKVWAVNTDSEFIETDETLRVDSRDPTFSASAGTYLQVALQGREWRPIWAACSPRDIGCGSITWRWQTGEASSTGTALWKTRLVGDSCGFEAWIWNDGHSGGGARWVRSAACPGGCAPSTRPPDDGVVNGQIVLRPCGNWEWYLAESNCLCGATPVMPTLPPDPSYETGGVTTVCTGGTCDTWQWVQIAGNCASCAGTTAPKPDRVGTEYETVVVPCT